MAASKLALLLAGGLLLAPLAHASHAWGGYHWARGANPVAVTLGSNLSDAWKPYLANTSSDWNLSSVVLNKIDTGRTSPKTCRPTAGRVEVCNARYGNNGWLGIAQIWASGSHISQGAVKLNDSYFNTAKYNTPAWRNLVSCQEVGHTFGLGHQDENFSNVPLETCMDYSRDPTPNQHPDAHDYEELGLIYEHVDGTAAAPAIMPPAMGNIDLTTPRQWGRLVRSSRNGMLETYEQDFGHGFRVITHVIWAEGRERRQFEME